MNKQALQRSLNVNVNSEDLHQRKTPKLLIILGLIALISILIIWLRQNVYVEQINLSNSIKLNMVNELDPRFDRFLARPKYDQTMVKQLPDLKLLQWPPEAVAPYPAGRRVAPSKSIAPLPKPFEPVISLGQRRVFQELLTKFAQVMSDNGFGDRYFLTGGTLLGSFRHHDMIPWDDDVDVLVDDSIRSKVQVALSSLEPSYRFVTNSRDKFFAQPISIENDNSEDVQLSRQSTSHKWCWPFLDISYYHVNDTHVIENAVAFGRRYAWPRDMIFPLYVRPYLGAWYPAPRNPLEVLILTYGKTEMCEMSGYSHVLEKQGPSASVLCNTLAARYAFVQHRPCIVNGSEIRQGRTMLIEERLILRNFSNNDSVIHSLCLVGDVIIAKSATYALGARS